MERRKAMNFFIGIPPPLDFSEKVINFQKSFPENTVPKIAEPHVTVKAQGGLDDELKWIDRIRTVCSKTQPFKISICGLSSFNDTVFYLEVESKPLIALHREIVQEIDPGSENIEKYYELDRYIPHLTLAMTNSQFPIDTVLKMKKRALKTFPSEYEFMARYLRIYRENVSGYYELYEDIPLSVQDYVQ